MLTRVPLTSRFATSKLAGKAPIACRWVRGSEVLSNGRMAGPGTEGNQAGNLEPGKGCG